MIIENENTLTHQQATSLIEEYFTLQTSKSDLDVRMKQVKEKLRDYAEANRDKFVDEVYDFDCCGYLRYGKRTVVKINKSRFDLLRVVKTFPEFLKKEFSVSAIKASFIEAKNKKRAAEMGVSLTTIEEFDIVRKDKVEDLPIA
jgi:hypothetical protein